ncbi:MAG: class E sortase [Peptococcaceae bacterium]|nr:class E sortase [Peptococcaceae bacterium]
MRRTAGRLLIILGTAIILVAVHTHYIAPKLNVARQLSEGQCDFLPQTDPGPAESCVLEFPVKISIPKINLEWVVAEAKALDPKEIISRKELDRYGAVHYPNTVLPGEAGICAIAGHRTTYGFPFLHLDRLESDDLIILSALENPDRALVYEVREIKVVSPTNTAFLADQKDSSWIALTTCEPKGKPTKRLIVLAQKIN